MKVKIDIECTPQEARDFFGLPDVEAMQKSVMGAVEQRLKESMAEMEMDKLMKTWMPAGLEGFEQMQKMFWSQFKPPAEK